GGGGAAEDALRVDGGVDLRARPHHAAPVQEVVADKGAPVFVPLVANVDAQFRDDRELVAVVLADVGGRADEQAARSGRTSAGHAVDDRAHHGPAGDVGLFAGRTDGDAAVDVEEPAALAELGDGADLAAVEPVVDAEGIVHVDSAAGEANGVGCVAEDDQV